MRSLLCAPAEKISGGKTSRGQGRAKASVAHTIPIQATQATEDRLEPYWFESKADGFPALKARHPRLLTKRTVQRKGYYLQT